MQCLHNYVEQCLHPFLSLHYKHKIKNYIRFKLSFNKAFNFFQNNKFLDSSKLKEFADNNFRFEENGRKFFRWVENIVGKREIAHCEQFLLFPQCFHKTCTADT